MYFGDVEEKRTEEETRRQKKELKERGKEGGWKTGNGRLFQFARYRDS